MGEMVLHLSPHQVVQKKAQDSDCESIYSANTPGLPVRQTTTMDDTKPTLNELESKDYYLGTEVAIVDESTFKSTVVGETE